MEKGNTEHLWIFKVMCVFLLGWLKVHLQ